VRKNPAASFEAYFFRGGNTPHWFDTPRGRIGVGICFENALYERYCEIHAANVDLYLRPFSGASFEAKLTVRQRDVDMLNAGLRDGTAETARLMGIPVVMANKVGRLVTEVPAGFPAQDIEFPGFSAVADSDGRLLGQLGPGREGVVVVVGMVTLDPALNRKSRVPPLHGRWNAAMPWWAFVWTLTQHMGDRSYARSAQRRLRALAVSSSVS
jgi:N-carbamoylputrescine amidase